MILTRGTHYSPSYLLVDRWRRVRARSKRTERERTRDSPLALRLSSFVILLSSPFVFAPRPSAVLLLVDRNKQQQSTRSPRRVGGSIRRQRRNIGAKEKGERCDGILLPDGNTSGRKGERERGVARKWTDRRKRLATGFFPSTDAERRRRRTARSPSKISAIFRRSHYRTPRGKLAFLLLFLFFYSSRRARNVARFPACTSAAEVLDRARRKRRSEVSLPETDPAC